MSVSILVDKELQSLSVTILEEIKSKVETLAGTVVTDAKIIWPTIYDLVSSGQLGKDIIKLISWLKPIITYIQPLLPQYSVLFTWILQILTIVGNLAPLI